MSHPLMDDRTRRLQAERNRTRAPTAPRRADPWLKPTLVFALVVVGYFVWQVLR